MEFTLDPIPPPDPVIQLVCPNCEQECFELVTIKFDYFEFSCCHCNQLVRIEICPKGGGR